jgi:MerR family copper efflux transcriptional regulator
MPPETPIACTLDAQDRPARLARARELGEQALAGLNVGDGSALLRFQGHYEAVDALVAAERACCPFFEFTITRHGENTEVEIVAPEGGELLLRGLVAGIVAGWGGGLQSPVSSR